MNNGDGGFNAIDPSTPMNWYTSHPDVGGGQLAIEYCSLGIGCHQQDFASSLVVTSNDLQGDASGSFNQAVQLSCSSLPSGAHCNFSPSSVVSPFAGSPVTVSLYISTTGSTPTGSYSITIKGSTTSPTITKTQALTLNVTAVADYVLNISNSPQSAWVNQSSTFNGKLTAANGYASPVNLTCAAGSTAPPSTCTPNPATLTPSGSGASFTVTTASNTGQSYSFNVVATGTDSNHVTHTFAVVFNSVDFSVTATPASQNIKPGQAANYVLHFVPVGGNFLSTVSLSCSSLPQLASCTFTPNSIASGSGATDIALAISTTGPNLAGFEADMRAKAGMGLLWLPLFALALSQNCRTPRQRKRAFAFAAFVTLAFLISLQGCGGGASTGGGTPPPPAPVSVSISPTSASVLITQNKQFQASVFGTSDTRVTWQVNNTAGGDSVIGTIDGNGLYTAPAIVPNPNVVSVTAVSVADNTKNASAAANVTSNASVTVSPTAVSVALGATQQFSATVTGAADNVVTWSVNGKVGGDSTHGTITSSGLYTAPVALPNPSSVTISAISQADWRQKASAAVNLASVSIAILPTSASVYTNGTQQFTATVTGTTDTQANWKVNGVAGGNTTLGTIDAGGLYRAPSSVPTPAIVTITAVSQADTTKTASASATILPSTPYGTFTITVTGTSGSMNRSTNITLNVGP